MKKLKILVLAAASLGIVSVSHAQEPLDRTDIDVEHYAMEITLSLDGKYVFQNSMSGKARISFSNIGDTAIKTIPVLLNRLMRFSAAQDGSGNPLKISQRLLEIDNFEYYQANVTTIELAGPLRPGEAMVLHLSYGGRLTGYADAGMLYTKETLDSEFTILRSEVLPFPMIAEPDWLEVREGRADPFTWQASFDVPVSHKVANGATRTARINGDRAIFEYRTDQPNTFLAFPIAPYNERKVGANTIYHLPGNKAGADIVADHMTRSMTIFEEMYGPLEDEGGLAIIEIPEGYGSQARFPTILQTADAFDSIEDMDQLYHELSHLWNVDSHEPQSPRLNEGLATFYQSWVTEKLGGEQSLDSFMAGILSDLQRTYERNPELMDVAIADFGTADVTYMAYRVGALFYYALYKRIGEEAFIDLEREFRHAYMDSGADFATIKNYYEGRVDDETQMLINDWLSGTSYTRRIVAAETLDHLLDQ